MGKLYSYIQLYKKIRELLKQNMDEIVKQSTSDEAGEESNEEDDQTVIESRWAAASAEHNLKTLKKLVTNTARYRFGIESQNIDSLNSGTKRTRITLSTENDRANWPKQQQ